MFRSHVRSAAIRQLVSDIVADIDRLDPSSAPVTPSVVLYREVDNPSRVLRYGYLSNSAFKSLKASLKAAGANSNQLSAYSNRWEEIRSRYKYERELHALYRQPMSALQRSDNDDSGFWKGLSDQLLAESGLPVGKVRADDVSDVIASVVDGVRKRSGEEIALKNAIILMKSMCVEINFDSGDELLAALTTTYSALDLAGLLGSGAALLMIKEHLEQVLARRDHPQAKRLLHDCNGIFLSHVHRNDLKSLKAATVEHSAELEIVRKNLADAAFASNWPYLYRGGIGAYHNAINVAIERNFPVTANTPIYLDFLRAEDLVRANSSARSHEVGSSQVGFRPDQFQHRLRSNMLLSRRNRRQRFDADDAVTRSAFNPDLAIELIDTVLDAHKATPYVSNLELAKLFSLKAEALLCLYRAQLPPDAARAFCDIRFHAAEKFKQAGDHSNRNIFLRRLDALQARSNLANRDERSA